MAERARTDQGRRGERVSEEDARRVWRRAAELQAEAARHLEHRSRELTPRSGGDEEPAEGYALGDVRAAAEEAGIAPEFVELALAELRDPSERPGPASSGTDRLAIRFLGSPPRSVEVSRSYHRPPAEVYEAMQRVFPAHPHLLVLSDTRGEDLLREGVLVFDVPSAYAQSTYTSFTYAMAWADLKKLYVTLRPVDGERGTRVTVHSPLQYSRRLNLWVGGALTAVVGTVGGIGGIALGLLAATTLAAAPPVGMLLAAAAAAGGAVSVGGGATLAYRALYRMGLRKGTGALEGLLRAVELHLRTAGGFSRRSALPPEAPSTPRFPPSPGFPPS